MSSRQEMFPKLYHAGPHKAPHGARGIGAHYHLRMDPILGEGKVAIRRIPCACLACTKQLDEEWTPGVEPSQQKRYARVKDCIYAPILGKYNNWSIIKFEKKKLMPRSLKQYTKWF